jgi:hypothetical protein
MNNEQLGSKQILINNSTPQKPENLVGALQNPIHLELRKSRPAITARKGL